MTLRSKNTVSEHDTRSKNTVSEHDTPIQEYCVGTWHSDPIIPCRNVTLRSHNTVSERDTPIQLSHYFISANLLYSRRHFNREGSRLEIQHSHNFRSITNHTIKTYNHTIKYIGDFTISLNTYQSLFRVYLSNRINHNLPPPKNRSQATTSSTLFLSLLPPNSCNLSSIDIYMRCKLTIP